MELSEPLQYLSKKRLLSLLIRSLTSAFWFLACLQPGQVPVLQFTQ